MTALVRASGLSGFTALVQQLGGDAEALAWACGIDPNTLHDEEALVPYRQVIHLLEHCAAELGVADFGLRLASKQGVEILGPLAVAIQNAATVQEAMQCAADYIFVHSSALRLDIEDLGETTRIGVVINLNNMPHWHMRQAEDLAIALVHRSLQLVVGEAYPLLRVELPHDPLYSVSGYEAYFGAPVDFGCRANSVYINSSVLALQLSERSSQLFEAAIAYLDVQFPTPDGLVATRVETAVRRTLGTGSCNRSDIAKAMAMHPRTLHRRLRKEGVTFDQIREQICREKAEYYLCQTNAPLAQIAGIIGYAEQAVLSRNCRRWFGCTPRELRATRSVSGTPRGVIRLSPDQRYGNQT